MIRNSVLADPRDGARAKAFGGIMAGKFELYTDARGEFRFRLKAGNGEVIAVSQGYSSKSGAKNGIASVQKNAPEAETVDLSE